MDLSSEQYGNTDLLTLLNSVQNEDLPHIVSERLVFCGAFADGNERNFDLIFDVVG